MIRPARPEDAPAQQDVERAAGARFRHAGMPEIADAEPMPEARLAAYASAGRAWVATDDRQGVMGYVVADVIDGCAHIEQVSVHPRHQGQGWGRALITEVTRWAHQEGLASITLTTFAHVPWNRPLYEHLGFRVLADHELTPGLRARRDDEARHGLDPAIRVCMLRSIDTQRPVRPDEPR